MRQDISEFKGKVPKIWYELSFFVAQKIFRGSRMIIHTKRDWEVMYQTKGC